jgi:Fe-S-cluster-containing dehydrogenase component
MTKTKVNRRDFIKVSILGGSVLGGLGAINQKIQGHGETGVQTYTHNWAMVIDQSKCIGCQECEYACQASNDINPDITWNRLYQTENVAGKNTYLSVPCMHCEHAPCVSVCPVGASYYRNDGIVMMDYDRCIGCRYCQVACPYGARFFNWEAFTGDNPYVPDWGEPDVARRPRGVVEKCTFCVQRIDRGMQLGLIPGYHREATPVCVNVCPTGARMFGDLNDPNSQVSLALKGSPSYRLKEELGTAPRVYYLPMTA